MSNLEYGCPWTKVLLIFLMVFVQVDATSLTFESYDDKRNNILQQEKVLAIGDSLKLTSAEKRVNDIIITEKMKMIRSSITEGKYYMPAASFYNLKSEVEESRLMKIIEMMPKGAALHLHDMSTASLDWVVSNVTYRDNLYFCVDKDYYMIFKFMRVAPHNPDCLWQSVQQARADAPSKTDFDFEVKKNISFLTTDPLVAYKDSTEAWVRFNKYFEQVIGMVFYAPVFKDYIYQSLEEMRADNIIYAEIRAQLFGLFDLDEHMYNAEYGVQLYQSVAEEFVQKHPDFLGAKIIMSGLRFKSQDNILQEVKTAMKLHSTPSYRDFFLGYDLVGEEPAHNSLLYYLDDLLYPSSQGYNLPYFFHAGETNWEGTESDNNLIDAVLLNATRIGHGYALNKHPVVTKLIKEKDIAIEICPLSNQLLGLVKDLRNHPLVGLMAEDLPVVISSDDPGTWEALPLSHDFYVALMTMSGKAQGLGFLKQLALNSLNYSVLTSSERERAAEIWTSKWEGFIEEVIKMYV